MRQPIGQRDLLEPLGPEDLHEDQVRVASVLDVMAQRLFYVADVPRMKVGGHRRRPGVEDRHPRATLEKIGPFIGIRMPVHLAQAARLHLNPCGRDRLRHDEVAAVGNPHRPALGLPAERQIGQAEHEGMGRLAGRGGHLRLDRF